MAKASQSRQSYHYTGPVITQAIGGAERTLFPGTSYQDLPKDDPVIKNLVARRVLIADTEEPAADPAKAVTAAPEKGTPSVAGQVL